MLIFKGLQHLSSGTTHFSDIVLFSKRLRLSKFIPSPPVSTNVCTMLSIILSCPLQNLPGIS